MMVFARQILNVRTARLLLLVTCYLLLVTAPTAQGQSMSNKDYIINMKELNTTSDTIESKDNLMPQNKEPDTLISDRVNFKVRTGFENIESPLPFSVSLSSDLIDFGTLSPTNPIIRTVDLSVHNVPLYGYSVIASEDHPLKKSPSGDGEFIPDTTCDNGTCSQENAGEWINALAFGFGYRCDNVTGADCDSSFSGANFYKHFADISNAQPPQSVMAGIGSKNKDVRLSYKVNISGNQVPGTYTNIVTYIAIPNF